MTLFLNVSKSLKHKFAVYLSTVNKHKKIEKYLTSHKIKKLQLGCGDNRLPSWLNSDLDGIGPIIPIDVTKKFPSSNSTFHCVFSEHLIEHLTLDQGKNMLREIFRILKPRGKVRIATPDLKFLIRLYNPKKSAVQKKYIKWTITENYHQVNEDRESYVINNFFRAWSHQFIYDFETLKSVLEEIGFININRFKPGKSRDPNLKNIESHWKAIGIDFNNLESMVAEGTKPEVTV